MTMGYWICCSARAATTRSRLTLRDCRHARHQPRSAARQHIVKLRARTTALQCCLCVTGTMKQTRKPQIAHRRQHGYSSGLSGSQYGANAFHSVGRRQVSRRSIMVTARLASSSPHQAGDTSFWMQRTWGPLCQSHQSGEQQSLDHSQAPQKALYVQVY